MTEKHIIILTPGFASSEEDLNCIPSLQLFTLSLKEHITPHISVIAFDYPFKKRDYVWRGINVYAIGGKNKKIARLLVWTKVILNFRKINKKKPVTAIYSFWLGQTTLMAYILSKLYKVKLLATAQGQDTKRKNLNLLLKYLKIKIICCSQFNANVLFESSKIKAFQIIPFGLNFDQNYFPPYNPDMERSIDIIGVGSLIPVKNYKTFIEIINTLVKHYPNLKVMLIGGGVEYNTLNQMIKDFNLQSNITLTGLIENRMEVLKYVHQSKIFLHTSVHEGQCYAFMEAAAYHLNIVCFNVGYPPPSSQTHICHSKENMIEVLEKLLQKKIGLSIKYSVPIMKETVENYDKLN